MDLAVRYLVAAGHRRIAHIDGGSGMIALARRRAYLDAMAVRGLGQSAVVLEGGETQLEGQRAAMELLRAEPRPTAVIAYNDDVAVAAVAVLLQNGIRVPDDLSVIGWDDTDVASLSRVPLTTVAQQPAELASAAFDRLMQRIDGTVGDVGDIILEPALVIRESAGPAIL
jgi:DNA-binding LacI/PurR family transcriptional regulator